MKYLSKPYCFRISEDDAKLIEDLKKYFINPNQFIRLDIREKVERDIPAIIHDEEKRKSKEDCPF